MYKAEFSNCSPIFMINLQKSGNFITFLFQILVLRVNFFCSFWLNFCPLDPDPGSQNLADPTDPDPKHCGKQMYFWFTR